MNAAAFRFTTIMAVFNILIWQALNCQNAQRAIQKSCYQVYPCTLILSAMFPGDKVSMYMCICISVHSSKPLGSDIWFWSVTTIYIVIIFASANNFQQYSALPRLLGLDMVLPRNTSASHHQPTDHTRHAGYVASARGDGGGGGTGGEGEGCHDFWNLVHQRRRGRQVVPGWRHLHLPGQDRPALRPAVQPPPRVSDLHLPPRRVQRSRQADELWLAVHAVCRGTLVYTK